MQRNKQAFTLIELLVVVLIIGILAAVAVPQYQMAVLKSRLTQAKLIVNAVAKAQEVYYLANGVYSSSFGELDIDTPAYSVESSSELNGFTRPTRVFDWGQCTLWSNDDMASCFIPSANVFYLKYYNHHATESGNAYCQADKNILSAGNKLCKSETGRTTFREEDNSYRWLYP